MVSTAQKVAVTAPNPEIDVDGNVPDHTSLNDFLVANTQENERTLLQGLISALTDKGGGKRESNEDGVLINITDDRIDIVVADGMGGHGFGEIASHGVLLSFSKALHSGGTIVDGANGAPDEVQRLRDEEAQRFRNEGKNEDALHGMGSVYVACSINRNTGEIEFVHQGDCQAMIIGLDKQERLTTPAESLGQALVDAGSVRSELKPQLFQVVHNYVYARSEKPTECEPQVTKDTLAPGERVIFASDGLYDILSRERVAEISSKCESAEECRNALRQAVREALGNSTITCPHTGREVPPKDDNITIVVYDHRKPVVEIEKVHSITVPAVRLTQSEIHETMTDLQAKLLKLGDSGTSASIRIRVSGSEAELADMDKGLAALELSRLAARVRKSHPDLVQSIDIGTSRQFRYAPEKKDGTAGIEAISRHAEKAAKGDASPARVTVTYDPADPSSLNTMLTSVKHLRDIASKTSPKAIEAHFRPTPSPRHAVPEAERPVQDKFEEARTKALARAASGSLEPVVMSMKSGVFDVSNPSHVSTAADFYERARDLNRELRSSGHAGPFVEVRIADLELRDAIRKELGLRRAQSTKVEERLEERDKLDKYTVRPIRHVQLAAGSDRNLEVERARVAVARHFVEQGHRALGDSVPLTIKVPNQELHTAVQRTVLKGFREKFGAKEVDGRVIVEVEAAPGRPSKVDSVFAGINTAPAATAQQQPDSRPRWLRGLAGLFGRGGRS